MGLPTGTVTLLFSDVESSTRLLLEHGPEQYAELLDTALALQRAAWRGHGGCDLGSEGDSCYVAFGDATAALSAAVAAQRSLGAHGWPAGAMVGVRMGLHTGTPVQYAERYVGIDVHRAARIAAAAHGGQVLMSAVTAEALAKPALGLLSGVRAHAVGRHAFKDLSEPEELFELRGPGLVEGFPPVRSLGSVSVLPPTTGRLFGRGRELGEVTALLDDWATRLVTLTGPGGSGKTRLALEVARLVGDRQRDGVHFVSLEHAVTVDQGWQALGSALDLPPEARESSALLEALRRRDTLLVLDNLEQLDGADHLVAELLAGAPDVRVLATARAALGVEPECEVAISPLALPQRGRAPVESPAVRFFADQAWSLPPSEVPPTDWARAAELCTLLDGLPLAIELGAARARRVPLAELLGDVRSVLDLPARDGGRTQRQRTVRETVRWSYELLDDESQRLFRLLGAFPGGVTMPAAASAARALGWQTSEDELVEVVRRLATASLVTLEEDPAGPRIRQLNTVRAFAAEELRSRDEERTVLSAMVEAMRELMADPAKDLSVANRVAFLDRIEQELPNLREAMRYLIDEASWDREPLPVVDSWLAFGSAVCVFVGVMGQHHREAFDWGVALVELGSRGSPVVRAQLMTNVSDVARYVAETAVGGRLVDTAAELVLTPDPDDLDRYAPVSCHVRLGLGIRELDCGHLELASDHFSHVLEHEGDSYPHTWQLINLGLLSSLQGDLEGAVALTEQGREMAERLADAVAAAAARTNVPTYLRLAGRTAESLDAFRDCLPDIMALPSVELRCIAAEDVACTLAPLGRLEDAALLFHAARLGRQRYSGARNGLQEQFVIDAYDATRAALGPRWEELGARAEQLTLSEALEDALR